MELRTAMDLIDLGLESNCVVQPRVEWVVPHVEHLVLDEVWMKLQHRSNYFFLISRQFFGIDHIHDI